MQSSHMNAPETSQTDHTRGPDPEAGGARPGSGARGPVGPDGTHWFQLGVICCASFVVWSGFGAILPYLNVFLKEQAHASMFLVGAVAAAFYVGSFSFSALLGRLSDSIGRKPVIVAGVVLYAAATLLFMSTTNPLWFIVFRLLEGMGAAAVTPAGQALVADLSTEATRSRAYGWLTTAQFGGLVAGPALAVPLYNLGGGQGLWAFYAIFLFGGVLSALTAVALLFLVKEPEHAKRRREIKVKRPPVRQLLTRPVMAFMVMAATGNFAMGVFEVLWSIWLRDLGASMQYIGLTWIAFSVPMLLAWLGGYLADRYSRWALMFSGYAVSAIAWITYGTTTSFTVFLVVNVVEGLAVAWSYPAKQGFMVQVVPARWLGSVQGLEQTFVQVAALVGTLAAPFLYAHLSGYVISLAGVISLLGCAYAAPILLKEWRRLCEGRQDCADEKSLAP
jgi:DHA1 family multidrug resistance protein-like MFS transporter